MFSEILEKGFQGKQVRDGSLGSFLQHLSDEHDDLVGGGIIEARHDGGGVSEFVLLEGTVQSLLDDFLIAGFGGEFFFGVNSDDAVSISGTVETDLIVFSGFPFVTEVSEPFVDLEVVKSNIADHLLLKSTGVGLVINAVLGTQSSDFSVIGQTGLHGFGDLFSEIFEKGFQGKQVRDGSLGSFIQNLSDEHNNLMGGGVIEARHDGGGISKFVLLKGTVQSLLDDLFVSDCHS